MKVAVLTVSDRASRGEYADEAGPLVARMLTGAGAELIAEAIVPDECEQIEAALLTWCNAEIDVAITTGGTGLGPRDVTPEATRNVIQREAQGLAEAMRAYGLQKTPFAALSRQVCGVRNKTLIVNLPGSPKAAVESLEAIIEILPHAVEMMNP